MLSWPLSDSNPMLNRLNRLVAIVLVTAFPACKKPPAKGVAQVADPIHVADRAIEHFSNDDQALAIVARFVPATPTILEAGAYHGETTLAMVQRWPGATVYTFEPVPELFEIVKKNTSAWPNVHPFELALSDKVGKAVFHLSALEGQPDASLGSGSLLEPSHHTEGFPWVKFDNTITVATTSIDEWAGDRHVEKIDFVWLDIQGAELTVLKAAPHIMKTVKAIVTEVEFVELYKGQSLYAEMRPWLEARGFKEVATDFDPQAPKTADLKTRKPLSWYGNSIFVRK
jgi:2-O-methyltransferase